MFRDFKNFSDFDIRDDTYPAHAQSLSPSC